jgi:hypothetical protein
MLPYIQWKRELVEVFQSLALSRDMKMEFQAWKTYICWQVSDRIWHEQHPDGRATDDSSPETSEDEAHS